MTELPINPESPWLAPLAGWSDLPFRLLCRERGAAVCCTEMVSAKGLVYGGRNTEELLATRQDDAPLVVQVFGSEASFMEQAVRMLRERGFGWFDVNMGCSVPKVNKTGSGSALLRTPGTGAEVAEAVIRAAGHAARASSCALGGTDPLPVSVRSAMNSPAALPTSGPAGLRCIPVMPGRAFPVWRIAPPWLKWQRTSPCRLSPAETCSAPKTAYAFCESAAFQR